MTADVQHIASMNLTSDMYIWDEKRGGGERIDWYFKPGGLVYEAMRREGVSACTDL